MTAGPLLLLDFSGVDGDLRLAEVVPPAHRGDALRVDPIVAHLDRRLTLTAQAAEIAEASGAVSAVVGKCSAAELGMHVAAQLSYRGEPPRVLLIEPYRADDDVVRAEFGKLHRTLGGQTEPVLATVAGLGGAALLDPLEEALLERRAPLVAACGGEAAADVAVYLLHRYRAWLRFLSASSLAPPVPVPVPVTVLAGTDAELRRQIQHILVDGVSDDTRTTSWSGVRHDSPV